MFEIEKVELSSVEVTAYWWINTLKNKIKDLTVSGTRDLDELKFIEIFYNYTDIEWRKLYLELIKYITEDINNYVSTGRYMGVDAFNQDTAIGRHDRLNTELTKILNCKIPDIGLASNFNKDSVIYTNMFGACEWYKSCGINNLPTIYDADYILTGDKKIFDFYNLLVATVAVLEKTNKKFNSVSILRDGFCEEYLKNNPDEPKEDMEGKFNYYFDRASDNDLIIGRSYQKDYFTSVKINHHVGLEKYAEEAMQYANIVLAKENDEAFEYYKKTKVKA